MRVLITGGLGYIGGRLAQHLVKEYDQENIRLLTRKKKKKTPVWADNFDVVSGDLLDEDSLFAACRDVDMLIHLAAVNEIDSEVDPKLALKVNGEGTLNILNAAIKNNVKRLIYFSTYHVYGLNAKGRITEETLPMPVHPYAITHHVAEDFVRMTHQKGDLKCTILRLSNGFGTPADPFVNRWSLVFNNLCLQAALTNKIVLKSSGKQQRDFITLTDICRAVEYLIKINPESLSHLTYNLGGENVLTILEVASIVAKQSRAVLGVSPEIIKAEDPKETYHVGIDYRIDRFKKLGFKLASNRDEEIIETLKLCNKYKEVLKCHLR
jgi:UDP-glucose 4-epimerase